MKTLPDNTSRLQFQVPSERHFDNIVRLQSDPYTMQFIRAVPSEAHEIRARINMWSEYRSRHPQLGVLVVEHLESGTFAGYCVMRYAEWKDSGELELGYVLSPENWGKGLATEVAEALAQFMFEHFPDEKIVAYTHPDNRASQKVLLKNGFEHVGTEHIYEGDNFRFEKQRGKI